LYYNHLRLYNLKEGIRPRERVSKHFLNEITTYVLERSRKDQVFGVLTPDCLFKDQSK